MNENVHATLHEAHERQKTAETGSRLVSLAAAIIAVLAALGALLTHNRSIAVLTSKNHAILLQGRASDTYNKSEAKLVRAQVLLALLEAGVYKSNEAHDRLARYATTQQAASNDDLKAARDLEQQSTQAEDRSEIYMKSYEKLEMATALFDIAIVLVSISALVRVRVFLLSGCIVSGAGIMLLAIGFFQGH